MENPTFADEFPIQQAPHFWAISHCFDGQKSFTPPIDARVKLHGISGLPRHPSLVMATQTNHGMGISEVMTGYPISTSSIFPPRDFPMAIIPPASDKGVPPWLCGNLQSSKDWICQLDPGTGPQRELSCCAAVLQGLQELEPKVSWKKSRGKQLLISSSPI